MRRLFLVATVIALLATTWVAQAAPPPDGPPGLAKAIAAQVEHNPQLLTTPGVVGTAVGLGKDGTPVVKVFTEKAGVGRLPVSVDGVPVVVQVTGKLTALKVTAPNRNTAPVVTITSPTDGGQYSAGDLVHFAATAVDKEEGNLSPKLIWTSSVVGSLGTGASFDHTLSAGTHIITASATDSRRKTGTDSVTVTVAGTPGQPKTTDVWARPVPTGVSTGNYQSASAGTIACRVVDAAGNVYALSNTHVYAPNDIDGQGEIGDIVTQPGLYDVPTHLFDPSLRLGQVTAYKPIDGSIFAFNDIDAAIALTDLNSLGNGTPAALGGYGVPSKVTKAAALNMAVQKFGRSTLLTKGAITGINATMAVGYADDWYAWFSGQIVVETSSAFIQPGDSGSLVVTDDVNANPVGLLFAGNADGTMAIVNPIDAVLQYFDVTIDGK
ncbi:MAG TPA: hypothetical protein VJ787_03445 [Thermoleophilia bacterium]|nr:hypothetical protein [Thermoleophilia bacterium]